MEMATGSNAPSVGDLDKVLQRPGVQQIVHTRITDISLYLAEQWTPLTSVSPRLCTMMHGFHEFCAIRCYLAEHWTPLKYHPIMSS